MGSKISTAQPKDQDKKGNGGETGTVNKKESSLGVEFTGVTYRGSYIRTIYKENSSLSILSLYILRQWQFF